MFLLKSLPRGPAWPQPCLYRLQSFVNTQQQRFHSTPGRFGPDIPPFATAFRAKSVYLDAFPCTLHHYSSEGPRLSLYDGRKDRPDEHPERTHVNRVEVGYDGLVDPALTSWWNGVSMSSNTLLQQQIWTNCGDWADECREKGWEVAEPWMFTLPKGDFALILQLCWHSHVKENNADCTSLNFGVLQELRCLPILYLSIRGWKISSSSRESLRRSQV